MNKYTFPLKIMQHCINSKDDTLATNYALNRLIHYTMQHFTLPLDYKDTTYLYNQQTNQSFSKELVNITAKILQLKTIDEWLELILIVPEPIFLITILKYLISIHQIPANIEIINHDDTFTQYLHQYGGLIQLATNT